MNRPLRKPMNAVAIPQCPCCGSKVDASAAYHWNEAGRTFSGRGWTIALSPHRGIIFNMLWKAWKSGRLVQREEIMRVLYADDPNGGPDSDDGVRQQVHHLKNALHPFGLSIKGRCGYALVCKGSAA